MRGATVRLQLGEHVIDTAERTAIMAILNVSRDSPIAHSRVAPEAALKRARELVRQGAAIVDVGAHSTSSQAASIDAQEEIERVAPVIEGLIADGIPVSVDTWTPAVARAAAEAGVQLLNDVTGFRDPAMVAVAAEYRLPAVAMHMRGPPKGHYEADQRYDDIAGEVRAFLLERARALAAAGAGTPWLDPGFDFGRSVDDNMRLLGELPRLVAEGYPVLVSASRKRFLAEAIGLDMRYDLPALLEATLAFHTLASALGAHVVRVHDVEPHARALALAGRARPFLREALARA